MGHDRAGRRHRGRRTDFEPSWGIVFDPALAEQFSGQISLLNDPRETMGAALKYLGYSLNTTSEDELAEATDLVAQRAAIWPRSTPTRPTSCSSPARPSSPTATPATCSCSSSRPIDPIDYEYFVPKEGGDGWVDTIAIPFDAPHPCTAHTFINWLLTAEHGAALTNWNYYSTPNEAALAAARRGPRGRS